VGTRTRGSGSGAPSRWRQTGVRGRRPPTLRRFYSFFLQKIRIFKWLQKYADVTPRPAPWGAYSHLPLPLATLLQQIELIEERGKSINYGTENRRRDVISLNQPRNMSAKISANGIRTHARTNQKRTLASRSRQFRLGIESRHVH